MNIRIQALAFAVALGMAGSVAGQTAGTTSALDAQTAQMDSLSTSRGEAQVIGKTADTFSGFAGSRENAVNLATGLRTGSEITLTGASDGAATPDSTTFTPATGQMGHGNVFKSLALAQQQLASQGITEPTPQQIEAALNGGTITVGEGADAKTVELQGVLQMRADGMGWGQIAHAQGTKLGPVVSALRSANASIAKQPKLATTTPTTGTTAGAGITTATGASATASGKHAGHTKGEGIVNAASGTKGSSGASHASRGIQNAMGGEAGSSPGNAYGKSKGHGIVTATGASAGNASAGAGIVSAAGGGHGNAAAASVSSHGRGAGVVSGVGSQGRGNAYGHGKKSP